MQLGLLPPLLLAPGHVSRSTRIGQCSADWVPIRPTYSTIGPLQIRKTPVAGNDVQWRRRHLVLVARSHTSEEYNRQPDEQP